MGRYQAQDFVDKETAVHFFLRERWADWWMLAVEDQEQS